MNNATFNWLSKWPIKLHYRSLEQVVEVFISNKLYWYLFSAVQRLKVCFVYILTWFWLMPLTEFVCLLLYVISRVCLHKTQHRQEKRKFSILFLLFLLLGLLFYVFFLLLTILVCITFTLFALLVSALFLLLALLCCPISFVSTYFSFYFSCWPFLFSILFLLLASLFSILFLLLAFLFSTSQPKIGYNEFV